MVRELNTGYYKHFKEYKDGNEMVYYVYDICEDTESGKIKVFYQAMYGDMKKYVRDLNMFLSPVDKNKYPLSVHEYRFRRMTYQEVVKWKRNNKSIVKEHKKQQKEYFKNRQLIY